MRYFLTGDGANSASGMRGNAGTMICMDSALGYAEQSRRLLALEVAECLGAFEPLRRLQHRRRHQPQPRLEQHSPAAQPESAHFPNHASLDLHHHLGRPQVE